MTDFEKWLQTTPEYKNLLIQHGERLFIMRDGEYEILTVRLAQRAWSNSRQLSKDAACYLVSRADDQSSELVVQLKQVIADVENCDSYTPMRSR